MALINTRPARAAVTAGLVAALTLGAAVAPALAESASVSADAQGAATAARTASKRDAAPAAQTVATITKADGTSSTYESFSAALAAAANGETVTLTASTAENVAVAKKITVTAAQGAVYSGTMSVHDGATITGMAFELDGQNGTTTSIAVRGAGDVKITKNTFALAANAATNSYNGIYLSEGAARVDIEGNTFTYATVAKNKDRVAVNIQGGPTIRTVNVKNNTLNVTGADAGKGSILLVSAFGNSANEYGIQGLAITGNTVTVPAGAGANVQAVSVQGVSGLTFTENTVTNASVALGGGSMPGQKTENADVSVGGNTLAGTLNGYNLGGSSLADGQITITKPDVSEPAVPAPKLGARLIKSDGTGGIYPTVQEAVAAADAGSAIALQKDLTEDVTIPANASVTLDLAGRTLTGKEGNTITNNGTLTVTDSSAVKSGVVDNVTNGKAPLANEEGATATLKGGTFKRSAESDTNSYYVLLNHGTMTIEAPTRVEAKLTDGTLAKKSALIDNGWYSGKPANGKNAQLTINGGTFEDGNYIKNDSYGELTINGGTVKGSSAAVFNWNKVTINGGSFSAATGKQVIWNGGGSVDADTDGANVGQLTITGGTFTAGEGQTTVGQYAGRLTEGQDNNVKVTVSGGTFAGALADDLINAQVSGGSFTVAPKASYVVAGSGLTQGADGSWGVQRAALTCDASVADGVLTLDVAKAAQLTEADLLKLVRVDVTGYTVTVDTSELTALNAAIANKDVSRTFAFAFTATKDGVATDTLTTTVTVKLTDSTPAPEPETKYWEVTFNDGLKDTADAVVKVKDGAAVVRPADPVHAGWKFVGWFTDSGFTKAYDFAAPVTGNLTLYGGWVKDGASADEQHKPTTPQTEDKKQDASTSGKKATLPKTSDDTIAVVAGVAAAGAAIAAVGVAARKRGERA